MTNKELYQRTFSHAQSSVHITWEDRRKYRPLRRLAVIAAVICALAALSVTAVAFNFLGLRDLLLDSRQDGTDIIGLSGYADTAEAKALSEWQAFLAEYDPDHAILNAIGNEIPDLPERYWLYGIYTQEMGDRLDEIAGKYGLKLHTRRAELETFENCVELVGGDFLGDNALYAGYMLEDGTFLLDLEVRLPDWGLAAQFARLVKGSMHEVTLNVGSTSGYKEWEYTNRNGTAVTLTLGPDKGLMFADLGDCFVTLNVLTGRDYGLTEADMEYLADSLDLSVLTPVRPLPEDVGVSGGPRHSTPEYGEERTPITAPQEMPVPMTAELSAQEKLQAVLLGQATFYDTEALRNCPLDDWLSRTFGSEYPAQIPSFTVLDLDGDGTVEAVLEASMETGTEVGYEILHEEDGAICGYFLTYRAMLDLKADGSYFWSDGAANNGFGRIEFIRDGNAYTWRTNSIARMESTFYDDGGEIATYTVLDEQAEQETYDRAVEGQTAKEGAAWYDFTPPYITERLTA